YPNADLASAEDDFQREFKRPATLGAVLFRLAGTPGGTQAIQRFIASLETPTQVHRDLANLIMQGKIRGLFTLMPDPLIEKALQEAAVLQRKRPPTGKQFQHLSLRTPNATDPGRLSLDREREGAFMAAVKERGAGLIVLGDGPSSDRFSV